MTNKILFLLRKIRALVTVRLLPSSRYSLATKSLQPISRRFGYDRGTPIDRYWIEKFLGENQIYITGRCLEITDDAYTKRFGGNKVTRSDVLDINPKNRRANIIDDLRSLKTVKGNTYDCLLLTQVLGMIDNIDAAIEQCHRILKPGGTILVTSACFSPTWHDNDNFWRFTAAGMRYAFGKHFTRKNIWVKTYGNVFSGQCFWVGMAQEEVTREQLEFNDPHFPCLVGLRAKK